MPIFKPGLEVIVLLWICDCRAAAPNSSLSDAKEWLQWLPSLLIELQECWKPCLYPGFCGVEVLYEIRMKNHFFMTCGLENNPRSLLHPSARSPVAASPLPLVLEVVIKWKSRARGREEGDLIRDLRGHFFSPSMQYCCKSELIDEWWLQTAKKLAYTHSSRLTMAHTGPFGFKNEQFTLFVFS